MTDLPNPDLLSRIPLASRTVLDVGCRTGALGAAFRRLNPTARLLGIDKDIEAAQQAALRLDDVVAGDVEEDALPFELADGLDCIVYGDVLEHLSDPWDVLRRHAQALAPEGTMLICVPNVEHWSFAARLLKGDWAYEPDGLLDQGHLRWFTLESMRKGLLALGLFPCDVHPRVFAVEQVEAFARALAPGLHALGIDPAEYAGRSAPLQYVWRVRARPRHTMTIGATMLRPVGGVSDVRVVYPMRALATDPTVSMHISQTEQIRLPANDGARIFVFHRPILNGAQGLDTIRGLLRKDFVVLTEFDDHPDFFEALRGDEQFAFTGVHAVQTSTPALAEVLRQRNPEVAVFPNAIRALPDIRNFTGERPLTLFFGALNREADWRPYLPILNEVAGSMGAALRFRVVHDRSLFDALRTPHKGFTPTCDHDTYLDLLGASEISFMPLMDTPFNRAKSDLKFIEAGACRVAPLASRVVYADSVEDGQTGALFDSPEELRVKLTQLLTVPDLAREIGDAARDYVARNRMLAYQVAPRLGWYRSLWDRRAELTAALVERVPALAESRS
jgi:SAM-dependent methyltransferase